MAIRQCTRHHFSDDEKYKVCPICLSLSSQNHENEDRTVAYTTPLDNVADKTIGYQALKDDVVAKPTVGWVVCVKGKNCGRDWRLHEGRNDIGTAVNAEVPIQLTGQECGCACSVIYDGKHKEFILVPGEVSLVYLNGQLLSEPQLLADGDQMCVGEEQLCFQSFCGEYR